MGGRLMVGVLLGGGSSDLEPWIPGDGLLGGGSSAMVGCDVGRWRHNGGSHLSRKPMEKRWRIEHIEILRGPTQLRLNMDCCACCSPKEEL